jgi:hypothetical protein
MAQCPVSCLYGNCPVQTAAACTASCVVSQATPPPGRTVERCSDGGQKRAAPPGEIASPAAALAAGGVAGKVGWRLQPGSTASGFSIAGMPRAKAPVCSSRGWRTAMAMEEEGILGGVEEHCRGTCKCAVGIGAVLVHTTVLLCVLCNDGPPIVVVVAAVSCTLVVVVHLRRDCCGCAYTSYNYSKLHLQNEHRHLHRASPKTPRHGLINFALLEMPDQSIKSRSSAMSKLPLAGLTHPKLPFVPPVTGTVTHRAPCCLTS